MDEQFEKETGQEKAPESIVEKPTRETVVAEDPQIMQNPEGLNIRVGEVTEEDRKKNGDKESMERILSPLNNVLNRELDPNERSIAMIGILRERDIPPQLNLF